MDGIIFLVFGEEFYKMAMKTISYSRKYTDIPFKILTNIRINEFDSIDNTRVEYMDMATRDNRQVKTTMINYSPFDRTIYMDCDAIIQKKGIENVFDMLDNRDIMLNLYGIWRDSRQSLSYYRITMDRLRINYPIEIYYGAIIGFNKTDAAKTFFSNWNNNWRKSGIRRDMPALACTIKKMPTLKIKKLYTKDNVFKWGKSNNAIIIHEQGNREKYWKNILPGGIC